MKIYFNGRHIRLAAASEQVEGYTRVIGLRDPEQELRDEVSAFAEDESLADTLITAPNFPVLRREFLKIYRIINAAGGLIHNGSDEYLIIDRKGVPDLPKGKAEPGESDTQTALREVEEETGLHGMNILDHIGYTYHTYMIGDERVLKRTAWFSMSVPDIPQLTPQAEEDITAARWVTRKQLRAEAANTYNSLKDIFLTV